MRSRNVWSPKPKRAKRTARKREESGSTGSRRLVWVPPSLDGLGGWEPFKGSAVAGTGTVSLWNRQLGFAGSRWGCGLGRGSFLGCKRGSRNLWLKQRVGPGPTGNPSPRRSHRRVMAGGGKQRESGHRGENSGGVS